MPRALSRASFAGIDADIISLGDCIRYDDFATAGSATALLNIIRWLILHDILHRP